MADEEAFGFRIEGDLDEEQVAREGDRFADLISRAFAKAAPDIGRSLAKGITANLRSGVKVGDIFDPLNKSAQQATVNIGKRFQEITKDAAALETRIQSTRNTLQQIGADPGGFAVIDREIERLQANMRDFEEEVRAGTADPIRLEGLEKGIKESNKLIFREIAGLQSQYRNLESIQRAAANRQNAEADRANQERILNQRQAHGKFIAETQREGAQLLAETRINGQKQLQDERQRSRTRIEIFRATVNQIKQLERGIAGVFRASGTILSTATGAVGGALNRLTGLFRRADRDMNDGLRGALLRREQSLSRSFTRQTESVRRETFEQSRVIQRFEAQASRGIAGAVTGRSALGGLLGGGLAIGGGFAAFQGLRNGIQVGGDFVQGLAVLGAQLELTEDQMAGVRTQAIELGNDISLPGVSALDAAQAIQLLAKQFANLGDAALPAAQGAAKGVLQLSRAAQVDAAEAARVVGAAVNVFRVNAGDAVAVADQITNALTKAAGVGFGDFADAFTQSAGVVNLFTGPAADATETLAEFNAAIAVLAKNGLIGSDAGTSLKQFFLQANRGTDDAKKILAEVADQANITGTVFFDAAGNARTLGDSLDILRRGLSGLSTQDLTRSLNKLFGSDAARAAAFLIGETTQNFDALTASIKRTGSAADIAAAQNTGLRGALDALGSVIETQQIKTYEKYQGVIGRVVLRFADLLNAFFEGEGIFRLVKAGLEGVAIAIGGLLAARVAAEGIQFLATAMSALATPLGLVVGSLVALGAGIGVLRATSPQFRGTFDRLSSSIQDRLNTALDAGISLLGRFSDLLTGRVLPAIESFAEIAAERISAGLRAAVGFITGTAIPALRTFAGVVRDEILPPVIRFGTEVGERIASGARVAADAVTDFARRVQPLVQPAIDGFNRLGDAIAVAFSGRGADVGSNTATRGILSGFAALGTGIARSFGNLGEVVIDALRPQLVKVGDFVIDFLSGAAGTAGGRLARAAQDFLLGPFQQAVSQIGFLIGNIASDPRFVTAVTQLLGLAALTGVNFVKGIGRGIVENLPELTSLIVGVGGDAITSAFRQVFNPVKLAKLITSTFGAAIIGVALLRALRTNFANTTRKASTEFASSLSSSLRSTFATSRSNPFIAGLLGGPGAVQSEISRRGMEAQRALQSEFGRINRDLTRLGGSAVSASGAQGRSSLGTFMSRLITDDDIKLARDRFGAIAKVVDPRVLSGALLRAQLSEVRSGLGGVFSGLGRAWAGDIQTGTAQVKTSLGRLRVSVADAFSNIRQNLRATGIGLGQALGGAIISGVGAALAGQQLGTATSGGGRAIGLAGIIATSLFAAASVGGGPQGAVVGAAVAGIGLVSAKLAANKQAAKDAAAANQEYLDILKQFPSAAQAVPSLSETLTDKLLAQGGGVQRILDRSGFNVTTFVKEMTEGSGTIGSALRRLSGGLGVDQRRVEAFINSELALGHTTGQLIDDLDKAARGKTSTNQALALAGAFRDAGIGAADLVTILETLNIEGGKILNNVDAGALRDQLLNGKEAAIQAAIPVENLADLMNEISRPRSLTGGQAVFFQNLADNARIAENRANDVRTAVANLNQQRVDTINSRIADLTSQLDTARAAADNAVQSVLDLVAAPGDSTAAASLNDLIQSVPGLAEQAAEALSKLQVDPQNIFAQADLDDVATNFTNGFRDAISKKLQENGGFISEADVAAIADQARRALDQVRIETGQNEDGTPIFRPLTAAEKNLFINQINGIAENPALGAALQNVTLAEQSVRAIQDQLAAVQAELNVKVIFSAAQIRQALRDAGLNSNLTDLFINDVPQFGAFATDALPGVSRQDQVDAQLVAAQTAARDQAEATGNMQRSADALAGAAEILAGAVAKPPVVQVAIPPGVIPTVASPSERVKAARLSAVSGLFG